MPGGAGDSGRGAAAACMGGGGAYATGGGGSYTGAAKVTGCGAGSGVYTGRGAAGAGTGTRAVKTGGSGGGGATAGVKTGGGGGAAKTGGGGGGGATGSGSGAGGGTTSGGNTSAGPATASAGGSGAACSGEAREASAQWRPGLENSARRMQLRDAPAQLSAPRLAARGLHGRLRVEMTRRGPRRGAGRASEGERTKARRRSVHSSRRQRPAARTGRDLRCRRLRLRLYRHGDAAAPSARGLHACNAAANPGRQPFLGQRGFWACASGIKRGDSHSVAHRGEHEAAGEARGAGARAEQLAPHARGAAVVGHGKATPRATPSAGAAWRTPLTRSALSTCAGGPAWRYSFQKRVALLNRRRNALVRLPQRAVLVRPGGCR